MTTAEKGTPDLRTPISEIISELRGSMFVADKGAIILLCNAYDDLLATNAALVEALRLHMQWIGPPPVDKHSFDSLRETAWAKGREALARTEVSK